MPRKSVSTERTSMDSPRSPTERGQSMDIEREEPVNNNIQANDSSLLLPIEDSDDHSNPGQAAFAFINDKIAEIGIKLY